MPCSAALLPNSYLWDGGTIRHSPHGLVLEPTFVLMAFGGTEFLKEPLGSGDCSSIVDFTGEHLKYFKIDISNKRIL